MISALTAGVQDLCLFEAEFLPFPQLLVSWFPLYNHCKGREGIGGADGAPWLTSQPPGGEGHPAGEAAWRPRRSVQPSKHTALPSCATHRLCDLGGPLNLSGPQSSQL